MLDGDGRFEFRNPALPRLLACGQDQLQGEELLQFITADDRPLVHGFISERNLQSDPLLQLETGDNSPAIVGVKRDISQQRQSRDELMKAKQLAEQASQAKQAGDRVDTVQHS